MNGFLYTPKSNTIVFTAHRTQDHVLSHTGNHSSCEESAGSLKTLGQPGLQSETLPQKQKTKPRINF